MAKNTEKYSFQQRAGVVTVTLCQIYNKGRETDSGRVQLKCDGTRWRTGGEVNGKLVNGVGSQYSSHYLGTWCI